LLPGVAVRCGGQGEDEDWKGEEDEAEEAAHGRRLLEFDSGRLLPGVALRGGGQGENDERQRDDDEACEAMHGSGSELLPGRATRCGGQGENDERKRDDDEAGEAMHGSGSESRRCAADYQGWSFGAALRARTTIGRARMRRRVRWAHGGGSSFDASIASTKAVSVKMFTSV
jgi:hypothetical protein